MKYEMQILRFSLVGQFLKVTRDTCFDHYFGTNTYFISNNGIYKKKMRATIVLLKQILLPVQPIA